MMTLIASYWILYLATGKTFTMQTHLHSSFRVHELVVVITSHKIFAREYFIDNIVYFLDGDEKDSEEIKFGLTLLGRIVLLRSEDYFKGDRLMAVLNQFWKCDLCMLRCFLKITVAACIAVQCFFVLLQRFSIYLQKSDLTVQTFFSCLVNLMGFFFSHFHSELFSSLVEVPIELHRLVSHLAKYCFFPKDAKRADGTSCWVALYLQAKKMVRKAACCALEKRLIFDDLSSSTGALNIFVVDETRHCAFQRFSEDILRRQFFLFLVCTIKNSQQIRRRICEELRRRMRLYCKARNIVQISS